MIMVSKNKPLKIVPKDDILSDILTLVVVIVVVAATLIFVTPNFTSEPITDVTPTGEYREPTTEKFHPVREPTEIESLINDLMLHNPADKTRYAHHPDAVDEVHVCVNMAIEQAEWIIENYDYDVGIVILHNRYAGDNHAQTWVDVNGTRYVIDSTSNYYWTEEGHVSQWKAQYGIQYTNLEKGRELEKANNEMLNNKNEPQLLPADPVVDVTITGDTDIAIGEKATFHINVETNMDTSYKLNVTIDDEFIIYHGESRQSEYMRTLTITHGFTTPGTHTISVDVIFDGGHESGDKITRDVAGD